MGADGPARVRVCSARPARPARPVCSVRPVASTACIRVVLTSRTLIGQPPASRARPAAGSSVIRHARRRLLLVPRDLRRPPWSPSYRPIRTVRAAGRIRGGPSPLPARAHAADAAVVSPRGGPCPPGGPHRAGRVDAWTACPDRASHGGVAAAPYPPNGEETAVERTVGGGSFGSPARAHSALAGPGRGEHPGTGTGTGTPAIGGSGACRDRETQRAGPVLRLPGAWTRRRTFRPRGSRCLPVERE